MDRNLRIRMLLEAGDKITRPMRDAAAGSSRLAQSLKAARDSLKAVERAQADIGAFRQLKTGLSETSQKMAAARAKTLELGRAIAQTENPTRKMRAEFNRAKKEAAELSVTHQRQHGELQALRTRLNAAGIATRDLASHERRLRTEAAQANETLRDQQRRLQEVTDRTRRMAAAQERFGKIQGTATGLAAGGAAAIGTGVTILNPLGAAVNDATEYQSTMTDINQKVNQSREAGRLMGERLREAAVAVNQMPADLQRGVDTLTGFGLGGQEAERMMTPIGRAATAYKAEIEDLSAAGYAVHDNLKVPIEQAGKSFDVMAESGKRGAFEVKDMAQYFPALSASMNSLKSNGIDAVGRLGAALQITRKGAGDASSAATNLQNLLDKINAGDTIKNFEKFGIDIPAAMKKAAKDGRDPIEEIIRLTQKATGGDQSKLSALFGDQQVQKALRSLMSNFDEYRSIRDAAIAAEGVVNRDFAERRKDEAEKVKALTIQAGNLKAAIGNQLMPTVGALSEKLASWANTLSEWAKRHPNITRALALTAGVLGGLFIILGGGAIVLAAIVAPFAALAGAATLLGIGMLPLIGIAAGVVAGIAALAAVAYLIYRSWEGLKNYAVGFWSELTSFFNGGLLGLAGLLASFHPYGLMYAGFAALMNWLGFDIPKTLGAAGRDMILGLIKGITDMFPKAIARIKELAQKIPEPIRKVLGIHSPSRVFAQIGAWTVQGLDRGIAGEQDNPVARINRLAGDISRAMVAGASIPVLAASPAAASTGSAAASIGPVSITIKQQPGQDSHDLARMIEDILRKLQRGDAAAARSSFDDEGDYGGFL